MRLVGSVTARMRISTLAIAKISAVPTAIKATGSMPSEPGRIITSTPRNPTAVAIQRRALTSSDSTITATSVVNSGFENMNAVASASGMWMIV